MTSLDYFKVIWDTIPLSIKIIFGLLVLIAVVGSILYKGLSNFLLGSYSLIRNIFYVVKLYSVILFERKRLETLINWKKNDKKSAKNYDSTKVKVVNVFDKDNQNSFLRATQKGYIVVIKQKIEDNQSKNLLNVVTHWVILDYLSIVRKYLSPELTMAITNKEIITKLREMKDYEAEKIFIQSMVNLPKINKFMEKLDQLGIEGIYPNVYIPYLRNLKNFNISNPTDTQKETEELIDWFIDYSKRLLEPTNYKFFPITKFLYVKLPEKEESAHIYMALKNFESDNCDVLIVSGWDITKKSIIKVSKTLRKYGYPCIMNFNGLRLKPSHEIAEEKYFPRTNYVHTKKEFTLDT